MWLFVRLVFTIIPCWLREFPTEITCRVLYRFQKSLRNNALQRLWNHIVSCECYLVSKTRYRKLLIIGWINMHKCQMVISLLFHFFGTTHVQEYCNKIICTNRVDLNGFQIKLVNWGRSFPVRHTRQHTLKFWLANAANIEEL